VTAGPSSELTEHVDPASRISVLDDEPDNRVLECAVSGRADMIVTGDRAMLSLGTFKDIEVVSLRAFLGRLQVEP
jgi:predicted nucleic acid-binding protein